LRYGLAVFVFNPGSRRSLARWLSGEILIAKALASRQK
jgi:hypothetical protein